MKNGKWRTWVNQTIDEEREKKESISKAAAGDLRVYSSAEKELWHSTAEA